MKIKICGITSEDEILFLNKLKPDFIGFVFADSKRKISIGKAKKLCKLIDKNINVVAVFKDNSFEFVSKVVKELPINIVQLHGMEANEFICDLRKQFKVNIWKGLCIESEDNLTMLDNCSADLIVLDGNRAGSGNVFPWRYLEKLNINKKIFLAGGINESNITEAKALRNIYGIDISSGVESTINGICKKDELKVKTIIEKVRESNER